MTDAAADVISGVSMAQAISLLLQSGYYTVRITVVLGEKIEQAGQAVTFNLFMSQSLRMIGQRRIGTTREPSLFLGANR